MSTNYRTRHDVDIELHVTKRRTWATIDSARFADGSPVHELTSDDLRDVAEMIEEAADDLADIER